MPTITIADGTRKEYDPTVEAVRETIRRCMREGVLVEFLSEKQTEVKSAMRHMYDQDEVLRLHDLEVRREVTREVRREESEKGICAVVKTLQAVSQSGKPLSGWWRSSSAYSRRRRRKRSRSIGRRLSPDRATASRLVREGKPLNGQFATSAASPYTPDSGADWKNGRRFAAAALRAEAV